MFELSHLSQTLPRALDQAAPTGAGERECSPKFRRDASYENTCRPFASWESLPVGCASDSPHTEHRRSR